MDGSAIALDVSTTIKATSDLSLYGRYANIGANFLSPQQGFREPINLFAGGVSWSPVRWITSSVTASMARRPVKRIVRKLCIDLVRYFARSGTAAILRIASQSGPSSTETASLRFLTITELSRTRFYANATRIKNSGPASSQLQLG